MRNYFSGRGFSLIEVLVSLVVISISFLGAMALHATALKEGQVSFYRNYASTISQSVLEQIRAQPNLASTYTITSAASATTATSDFKNSITNLLPAGSKGAITVDDSTRMVKVQIYWSESKVAGGDMMEFTYESQY